MEDVLDLLTNVETKFDEINADYGSKKELCIYCKAKSYNAKVGIIHTPNCIIIYLRNAIKEEKEFNKIADKILKEVQ